MRRRSTGFTLIEMLAAVAVLAIAMAAILSGMARYADNAAYLRERTIALWVAHNRLTEIELQPTWPDTGKSDGDMQMAGRLWTWKVEVIATPDAHLRRVNIEVESPGRDDAVVAALSAFIADTGRQ
ncbi:MAG: type II secretion system minor pseudopilin GspI [Nevskiales bacterium]|nr:type II secretion system minor pseudopilin GspI [Nevskiales bacterium]